MLQTSPTTVKGATGQFRPFPMFSGVTKPDQLPSPVLSMTKVVQPDGTWIPYYWVPLGNAGDGTTGWQFQPLDSTGQLIPGVFVPPPNDLSVGLQNGFWGRPGSPAMGLIFTAVREEDLGRLAGGFLAMGPLGAGIAYWMNQQNNDNLNGVWMRTPYLNLDGEPFDANFNVLTGPGGERATTAPSASPLYLRGGNLAPGGNFTNAAGQQTYVRTGSSAVNPTLPAGRPPVPPTAGAPGTTPPAAPAFTFGGGPMNPLGFDVNALIQPFIQLQITQAMLGMVSNLTQNLGGGGGGGGGQSALITALLERNALQSAATQAKADAGDIDDLVFTTATVTSPADLVLLQKATKDAISHLATQFASQANAATTAAVVGGGLGNNNNAAFALLLQPVAA